MLYTISNRKFKIQIRAALAIPRIESTFGGENETKNANFEICAAKCHFSLVVTGFVKGTV